MQAKQESQKLQMEVLLARETSISDARDAANKESPMAALNRRLIIWGEMPLPNNIRISNGTAFRAFRESGTATRWSDSRPE